MSDFKRLMNNLSSVGIIQIANFIMPLISVPIISRIIGPERFGVIQYANAFVLYFNVFIGYGFNLSATRRLIKEPGNAALRSKIFSEVFWCQSMLFVLSGIVLAVLTFSIPALSAHKSVALYSFLFCISSLLTQNWIFQAMQDMSKVAILNISGKIIYLLMVIAIIRKKELYYWQPLSLSFTQIVIGAVSFSLAKQKYQLKLVFIPLRKCITMLWNERFIFFSVIYTTVYTTFNIVILGFFDSALNVGYYTASQRLILVILQVLSLPISQVLFPHIGKAFAKDRNIGVVSIQKFIPIVLAVSFIIGAVIFLFAKPFLLAFYGEKFAGSILIFQVLAFVPMISTLSNMLGVQVMLHMHWEKDFMRIMMFTCCLSLVTSLAACYNYGFVGAAIAWLITEIANLLFLTIYISKKGVRIFEAEFFKLSYYRSFISQKSFRQVG